jgi:outer membrane immunogenic protein
VIYDWGGGYIGINGGYAFGQSEWGSDPLNPSGNSSTGNFHVNGGLVGGTMGVSGQWGAWVLGVEGDFDWQGLKGTITPPSTTPVLQTPARTGLSCKTASNWLGTFRVRFGYAWDHVPATRTAKRSGNVRPSPMRSCFAAMCCQAWARGRCRNSRRPRLMRYTSSSKGE